MMDPSYEKIQDYFKLLSARGYALSSKTNKNGSKGLVFYCYFSGHGVLEDGTTRVILPSDNMSVNKNPFPLEVRLRNLKLIEHCYIIGVFDCCRQIFKSDIARGDEI